MDRKIKMLYIIGNGFDLQHGLPTRYTDFHEFLLETNPTLLERMSLYYNVNENSVFWSDFEESLQYLDPYHLMELYTPPRYMADDFSCSEYHQFQQSCKEELQCMYNDLTESFSKWISQIEITKEKVKQKVDIPLSSHVMFLTFNYTKTLELIYNIPKTQILHIHGISGENSDLVYGHSVNRDKIRELLTPPDAQYSFLSDSLPDEMTDYESSEYAYDSGIEQIALSVSELKKDTRTIICENQDFFNSLSDLREIRIYGHSLSSVDVPYFEEIFSHLNREEIQIRLYSKDVQSALRQKQRLMNMKIPGKRIFYDDLQSRQRSTKLNMELEGWDSESTI